MAYPATDLPQSTPGEFVDENDWNGLVDALNFLAARPACRLTDTGGQSVANDTDTLLLWDTETYDTDSMHSTSVNTGRITFNKAGIYVVTANIIFPTNGNGYRHARIMLDDTVVLAEDAKTSASVVTAIGHSITAQCKVTAGQFVVARCKQTTGGSLSTTADSNFEAVWVGRG